jgi:spore photoproduct lyase
MVLDVGDGSIIHRFDKTPPPVESTDVVCPHFLELKWAYGCPFDCAWCYLKGTLRFQPTGTMPRTKNLDKVKSHLARFLLHPGPPELLNSGELADSLMNENNGQAISKHLTFRTLNFQNSLFFYTHHRVVKDTSTTRLS